MELATTSDPSNIIAWCMRGILIMWPHPQVMWQSRDLSPGLFYEMQTERVLEEMCYEEAVRVWRGRTERTYLTIGGGREGGGREEDAIRARDSHREGTREGMSATYIYVYTSFDGVYSFAWCHTHTHDGLKEEEERDGEGGEGEREATTGSGPSTTPGEQQDLSPAVKIWFPFSRNFNPHSLLSRRPVELTSQQHRQRSKFTLKLHPQRKLRPLRQGMRGRERIHARQYSYKRLPFFSMYTLSRSISNHHQETV